MVIGLLSIMRNFQVIKDGFNDLSSGYIDGWNPTCKKNGLDTSPGSGCDSSINAGPN